LFFIINKPFSKEAYLSNNDFVVRFAGEGGQGMVTSAEGLAQAAAQVGYHVQTFITFPSQIMGGPTFAQTRISVNPIHSSGDYLDALICFNEDAYETHKDDVRKGGIVIYNSEAFQLEDSSFSVGLPFAQLAKSTGNARAENMIVIGAFAYLINMPKEYLEAFITKRFTRGRPGDEEIIRSNIQAFQLGSNEISKTGFQLGELPSPQPPEGQQILIKGNDSLALGAIAAGVNYFVGYPISPATTILVYMERNLVGPGRFVYQASSEIESINAIVGGGYSGAKAMTSTSGPGFSLMSEGIGLAWMAEIPLVIANIQRGGPATGLPTKTEQSDFLAALHPAHGDASIPIIAPGSVSECYDAAIHAFNWAERYQGPVVLLSDHQLSERSQNIPRPNPEVIPVERRQIYNGNNGYLRYEGNSVSPMPLPGGKGAYVANASEHDPSGDTTHLPHRHVEMTERRFAKLKLLENEHYERLNADKSIAVMPWGATKGSMKEAYGILEEQGLDIAWYYTMFLHPLPKKLLEELQSKELIIVPELNYLGQFASYLKTLDVNAKAITQYMGLPFKVANLVERVTKTVTEFRNEKVLK
jgi:2-oxoglutarate ferredoxin oxidoreductase subunit alpha